MPAPPGGRIEGGEATFETEAVSRLAPFGRPAFLLGQARRAGNGESIARFDRFALEPVLEAAR